MRREESLGRRSPPSQETMRHKGHRSYGRKQAWLPPPGDTVSRGWCIDTFYACDVGSPWYPNKDQQMEDVGKDI